MLLLMLETGAGDYRTPSSRHQPWSYIPAESAMMSRVIAYRRSDRNRADREIAWFDSARPRVQSDQSKARYATLLIARPQRKAQNTTISTILLLSTFGVRRTKAAFPVIFRVNGCFVMGVCVCGCRGGCRGFCSEGHWWRGYFFRGAIESKTKVGIWMVVG